MSDQRLILLLGANWWGSDARALAVAFRRLGHAVITVNYEDFYPVHWSSLSLRVLRKACQSRFVREYNRVVQSHLANAGLDFVLVFKGKFLDASTLRQGSKPGRATYCFYPDVSFLDHGTGIWDCLPLYDCVFTTKSYHMGDARLRARVNDLRLVAHGFDPDVHRRLTLSAAARAGYGCDVSFVGCRSAKKEQFLKGLVENYPGLDLRIWGTGWASAASSVRKFWQGRGAYGDELTAIYNAAKINLGLLSEAGGGTEVGDQVTAPTWQIPATGAFMLHEQTEELERYFAPGKEVGTFDSPAELATKVRWFLDHPAARQEIASAGQRRCVEQDYTYLPAAQTILAYDEQWLGRSPSDRPRPSDGRGTKGEDVGGSHLSLRSPLARRLLFVGPLVAGSTTLQRLQAFHELGWKVAAVSTRVNTAFVLPSFLHRITNRFLGLQDKARANDQILTAITNATFDMIWIEKGLVIDPSTLRQVRAVQPACRIVGFSLDDMMNPANQSSAFLRGLSCYDSYITSKSYNVTELKDLGCPQVAFMDNAFDPRTHRPVSVSFEERKRLGGGVGFVGQWEPERADSIRALARAGIPVRVWGYTWERMHDVPSGLLLENQPVWGDDYAKTVCAFDINLCFLRKVNRDLQTTRSIEIPACGGFLLAERTNEHLRLFKEGKEAEFFSDKEELIRKAKYYLAHPAERSAIARAGRERCLLSGYSYPERLSSVLDTVLSVPPSAVRRVQG